jgi:hypothetical protein
LEVRTVKVNIDKRWANTILVIVLFLFFGFTDTGLAQKPNKEQKKFPKIRLISPKSGEALVPGEKVLISWTADIPRELDLRYCEQEIYLSLDGGKTRSIRITGRLPGTIRKFVWTVPNLQTENAVLILHFGTEGGGIFFEKAYVKKESAFRINQASDNLEEIELEAVNTLNTVPGDKIELRWQSSVVDPEQFEVMVSFDRGARFESVGNTSNQNFIWTVPDNFSGAAIFKIVAKKLDGVRIESVVPAEPMVIVE